MQGRSNPLHLHHQNGENPFDEVGSKREVVMRMEVADETGEASGS